MSKVSVADYPSQIYHPDRDYLEGTLMERNVGEIDHSDAQGSVLFFVRAHYRSQFWAGPETRVQILPERFRIRCGDRTRRQTAGAYYYVAARSRRGNAIAG